MKKVILFTATALISSGIAMNVAAQEKSKTENQKTTVTKTTVTPLQKNDKGTTTVAPKEQKVLQTQEGKKEVTRHKHNKGKFGVVKSINTKEEKSKSVKKSPTKTEESKKSVPIKEEGVKVEKKQDAIMKSEQAKPQGESKKETTPKK